ncbi:MAG: hypothetical protein HN778_04880 [Prolixibacteraceae bacterium]|jgi:hypothetical protein|nr:hypothetical protein [Prolixibacteraceae bacterium]MBT6004639.1 hypothetical protein [Prolixibacteraceae bacterium]MBT6766320.1 hypothetical protein [Prolixibacteraceae bacterium]MBT6998233.1 hypothetical protein [Prolixibacteraceae bacterium]MBT7394151.1 hypothetical protein [Prolixibacteraceae bacterium]
MKSNLESISEKMNFSVLSFDVLSENEMLKVRGGTDAKPVTRDKDIYDLDED